MIDGLMGAITLDAFCILDSIHILHCGTSEFILVPQIVAIKLPMLSLLLMRVLAFTPL